MKTTPPLLTLDFFARSMRYDALSFQGVQQPGQCEALDCYKRNTYIQTALTAEAMIQAKAVEGEKSLYDEPVMLTQDSPTFWIKDYELATYTHRIVTPSAPINELIPLDDVAALTAVMTPVDPCEEIVSVTPVWPDCECLRLGIEWCASNITKVRTEPVGLPAYETWTLVYSAKAYNFIRFDEPGTTRYLAPALKITTRKVARPRILVSSPCLPVEPQPCTVDCWAQLAWEGCYLRGSGNTVTVEACGCGCAPDCGAFQIDVVKRGVFKEHWQEAILAIANTLLPVRWCNCDPLANDKWLDDRGESDRYAKTYPYSFWNPFSIPAPGAQRAWGIVEPVLSESIAWSSV